MARPSPNTAVTLKSDVLPLPPTVLEHHGQTLFPIMKQWKEGQHVPPVLLLTGPQGIGKREVCHFLGQWLLCQRTDFKASGNTVSDEGEPSLGLFGAAPEPAGAPAPANAASEPTSEQPCGECPSCQHAMKGSWVDFTEISPETSSSSEDGSPSNESGKIKIEQFRKIISSMGFGAHESAFKIHLIRDADQMTPQAANSLLKILEEPPKDWIFFLTASDPTLLLPTLVSRCQKLRLKPFATEELQQLLSASEVPPARKMLCAELAQGSWKKALALAEDEGWEKRESVVKFIANPRSELNAVLDWAAQGNSQLTLLLDHLEQLTLELIRSSLNNGSPSPQRSASWNQSLANHLSLASRSLGSLDQARTFWITQMDRMARARREMLAPLNKKLLVQDILMPWLKV